MQRVRRLISDSAPGPVCFRCIESVKFRRNLRTTVQLAAKQPADGHSVFGTHSRFTRQVTSYAKRGSVARKKPLHVGFHYIAMTSPAFKRWRKQTESPPLNCKGRSVCWERPGAEWPVKGLQKNSQWEQKLVCICFGCLPEKLSRTCSDPSPIGGEPVSAQNSQSPIALNNCNLDAK
jgi:hypothetical protein